MTKQTAMQRLKAATADNDLSAVRVGFADSVEALDYALHHGLPEHAVIRSSAPGLLLDAATNAQVEPVEKDFNPAHMMALSESMLPLTLELRRALRDAGFDDLTALLVARLAMHLSPLIHRAMGLTEADFC